MKDQKQPFDSGMNDMSLLDRIARLEYEMAHNSSSGQIKMGSGTAVASGYVVITPGFKTKSLFMIAIGGSTNTGASWAFYSEGIYGYISRYKTGADWFGGYNTDGIVRVKDGGNYASASVYSIDNTTVTLAFDVPSAAVYFIWIAFS
jgi:hypothetical protein